MKKQRGNTSRRSGEGKRFSDKKEDNKKYSSRTEGEDAAEKRPRRRRISDDRSDAGSGEERGRFDRKKGSGYGKGTDFRSGKRGYGKPAAGEEQERQSKRPGSDFKKKRRDFSGGGQKATPPRYDFNQLKKNEEKVPVEEKLIRLNRYIANAGVCSRREADQLISEGRIKVNGKVVTELGTKVSPVDRVDFEGKQLSREKLVYVLLNKPKDFITTTDDPHQRKTVMDLVANACDERIYPVGRLDRNTTGLLLLTNDGELSDKLAHPSHKVKKIYQVAIDKPITEEDFDKIVQGVVLEDGPVPVDAIEILTDDKQYIGIEIHVGRNRIVRRLFEHLGYEVTQLDRVMYAGLTKKDLPRGNWRYLTQKELIRLKHFGG